MKFIKILKYIVVCFLLSVVFLNPAYSKANDDKTAKIDSLIKVFQQEYTGRPNLNTQNICAQIEVLANELEDPYYSIMSNFYCGASYITNDFESEAFGYLSRAIEIYEKNQDVNFTVSQYSEIALLYNIYGIYAIDYNLDYNTGINSFTKGAKLAEDNSLDTVYGLITYNIIFLNYIRDDSSATKLAREIYQKGINLKNEYLELLGSFSLAMMDYLVNDYESALAHIEKANDLRNLDSSFASSLDVTYANILAEVGNIELAEKTYKKALNNCENETLTNKAYIHLYYGGFLFDQMKYRQAIDLFNEALSYTNSKGHNVFLYQIYNAMSQAYAKLGDNSKALKYYKLYHREYSRVFNIQNERDLKDLSLKYISVVHDSEIQKAELATARKTRELIVYSFVSLVILIFAIFMVIIYRNKNKLYTKIVLQHKETLSKEKKLRAKNKELQERLTEKSVAENNIDKKYSHSALTTFKGDEIFATLEKMMQNEKVFKEVNLTQESLAERLGTNRTYLSQIISENTSKTFSQYVNSYRIEEALTLMSDTTEQMQLKAICFESGFASRTTFYRIFKESVGMAPIQYLERVREIS